MRMKWAVLIVLLLLVAVVYLFSTIFYSRDPVREYKRRLSVYQSGLVGTADILRQYGEETGKYPSNDEGLGIVDRNNMYGWAAKGSDYSDTEILRRELQSYLFIIERWGGVPVVYENRRGIAEENFSHSPINGNLDAAWCEVVDDDIYIYSLQGRKAAAILSKEQRSRNTCYLIFIALFMILVLMYIRAGIKEKKKYGAPIKLKYGTLITLFVPAFILIGLLSPSLTCYVRSMFNYIPEEVKEYTDLIEEFHKRGVINKETYEKLKNAVTRENFEKRMRGNR
jgi:hypothetical protein